MITNSGINPSKISIFTKCSHSVTGMFCQCYIITTLWRQYCVGCCYSWITEVHI
uniref:Uncharacterized protein n=1 Tax=Anguilla anguilla TaxID=7936 RepID=A0A0E9VNB2_ANGAN